MRSTKEFVSRYLRRSDRDEEHRIVHQIDDLLTVSAIDPDADDERLLASLLQAGVNALSAKRLVVLVPSAFGRDAVSRLGVRLDPNVEILSEDGSDRTVRRLDSFLEFRVAMDLIPKLRDTTAYRNLAAHSSEVNAVEAIRAKTGTIDVSGASLTAVLVTWDIL